MAPWLVLLWGKADFAESQPQQEQVLSGGWGCRSDGEGSGLSQGLGVRAEVVVSSHSGSESQGVVCGLPSYALAEGGTTSAEQGREGGREGGWGRGRCWPGASLMALPPPLTAS